jgi:flagellar biosynthesis/type III secretory pathway M-ring protein FliF/YscJ
MLTPGDARRRWFGALFLALAGGMLIWGQTVLKPHLTRWGFLIYWLACFALTGLAILVALLDLRAVRRSIREQQKAMLERALTDAEWTERHKPNPSARSVPKAKPGGQNGPGAK